MPRKKKPTSKPEIVGTYNVSYTHNDSTLTISTVSYRGNHTPIKDWSEVAKRNLMRGIIRYA